jgi:AAA domain/Toprim-like
MNAEQIAKKIDPDARRSGDSHLCRCPAHEDRNPSLSIRDLSDRVVLHCHAGCEPQKVVSAVGLKMTDLFHRTTDHAKLVATYDYYREDGKLDYQVLRFEPKAFRQRRPDGCGGWEWNLKGVTRILYNLPDVLSAKQVMIVEGEKDVESARTLGLTATCNSSGAGKWRDEYSHCLQGKDVVIIADGDEPGRKHAQQIAASILGKASSIKLLELPGAKDLTEWIERGGNSSQLVELFRQTPEKNTASNQEVSTSRLRVVSAVELLSLDIHLRELILAPFLPTQGLVMLYSKRGVGKTYISLGIAVAVASGGEFLGWKAPVARKVLYIDGEMPSKSLQERLASVIAGSATKPVDDLLQIITPDLQDRGLPDLASLSGQDLIEEHLQGVSLVVLDNLSSLVRAGKENEGEAWLPVQDWALRLRRRGIGVLFDHHAGKSGSQRGTSRREDLLDSVLILKHPTD